MGNTFNGSLNKDDIGLMTIDNFGNLYIGSQELR